MQLSMYAHHLQGQLAVRPLRVLLFTNTFFCNAVAFGLMVGLPLMEQRWLCYRFPQMRKPVATNIKFSRIQKILFLRYSIVDVHI